MIDLIYDMNFSGNRATGVQYIHRGTLKMVFATKEIILSAGAIGSPQILLLSGIGPAHHLEQLKVMSTVDHSCLYLVKMKDITIKTILKILLQIPMIQDLPVGENLQEHVFSNIEYTTETDDTFLSENTDSLKSTIEYALFGTGNSFQM